MAEFVQNPSSPPAHRHSTTSKQHSNDDLQPWTAARCQRLLRQLQSRITCLRKLVSEARKPSSGDLSNRPGSDDASQPAPKRSRYTYAQRRPTSSKPIRNQTPTNATPPRSTRTFGTMKLAQCSPATGRVDFKTPVMRKIREQPDTPIICPLPVAHISPIPSAMVSDLKTLRRTAPEGHYRIYEAIFTWLITLLRSTETQASDVHPKSLLGMCLRKVPAALAEIEAWDRKKLEESGKTSAWGSSNACLDLYDQLEGFGSTSLGWKPLKIVVRMHAMSILTAAISEDLFSLDFVYLLTEVCTHVGCNEEAARIVSHSSRKFAAPQNASSVLSETSKTRPLQIITGSFHGKNSPGASFDCLSGLISSKKLPLGWLSTRAFRGVWIAALESMTTKRLVPSTLSFVCAVLEHLALNDGNGRWSRQDGREQTLLSLAAGISATALILDSENRSQPNFKRRRAYRRLLHALDTCISNLSHKYRASHDGGFFILSLAQHLASMGTKGENPASKRVGTALRPAQGNSSHVQYRQALILICSTAQFRGRACGAPCHDILSEICDSMDMLGFPDWFRDGLRTDGAFVLAQKTKDLRDLAFAERLPAMTTGGCKTKTIFSGWQWDEGISEWVMPSPTSKPVKSRRSIGAVEQRAGSIDRRGREEWRRHSEPEQWGRDVSSNSGSGIDTDVDVSGSDSDSDSDKESNPDDTASDCSQDELQISASQRPTRRPRESPTCRVSKSRLATTKKRDARGRLDAKNANVREVVSGGPRLKVSSGKGLVVSGGSKKSIQGTVVKQLRDVKGPSQIHGRGKALLEDDWDELI